MTVDIANGQVVIIIVQIHGNSIIIIIGQRVYPPRFIHIGNTVVIIVQIHIIAYSVVIVVHQRVVVQIIGNTVAVGILGILARISVVIIIGVFVLGQNAVIIIIIIQIVRRSVAVGIVIGGVAVLGDSMRQGHVFVNRQDAVAVVVGIEVIGQATAIGILGIFGIMVSVRVGIFDGGGHMVIIVVSILKIIYSVAIRITHRIIQCSAIGRCFQHIDQTVGSNGIVQVAVKIGIASDGRTRFGKIKEPVTIAIQINEIGHSVTVGIESRFYLSVGVAYGVIVIIVVQIHRNAVIVGIGLRVDSVCFNKVGDTVIIIVNIHFILDAVAIEIGHGLQTNILSNK